MDFMKVAIANKPNEAFAKPNAPKRQVEVPVEQDMDSIPAAPPPSQEGGPEPDDQSAPDATPAPASVAPPTALPEAAPVGQQAPAPIVRMPPKPQKIRKHSPTVPEPPG
jgi:penicillin-binding protein 1A